MGVTIKDIAKIANVSHTTVSRALNDSPLINEATKERIRAIARELNYTPNVNARSLVLHRSYNIGLFFSTLDSGTSAGFFYDAVRGVNCRIKGQYNLVVKAIEDYSDFHSISEKSFDGIIVMSQSADDNTFIEAIIEKGIPQVVLNRNVTYPGVHNILTDDYTGAFNMVKYLIDQGHERIAIIEGKKGFQSTKERSNGYLDAMREHDLPVMDEQIVRGSYSLESGFEAMQQLLKLDHPPTAVFCSNDDTAVGAIKAVQEAGLVIPDDISIAGFDDSLFSRFITPALTTVKRPIEQISKAGADKLIEMIEKPKASSVPGSSYFHTEMIIRQSVGKRKKD